MRDRVVPVSPKENITRLEYEPGRMFAIHIAVGDEINGVFVPIAGQIGEVVLIENKDLTNLEENEGVRDAIALIMAHAWTKVDERRGAE